MSEETKLILANLSTIFTFLGPILSGLLLAGMKTASKNLFDAIVETKLLRQTVTDLKKEIADLPKMRLDINEAHTRIKFLQEKNVPRGKQ